MPLLSGFESFVHEQFPLAERTWLRLGGPAELFAEPANVDDLVALIERCRDEQVPIRVLGGGSNLLVRDEGVKGVVVNLDAPAFGRIECRTNEVCVGGGASLANVISETVRAGQAGLESLVGIPGTVGGALHGNAGSHGGDVGQWASRATVVTRSGEILERDRADLVFAYRQSSLDELVILEARFELEEEDPQVLTKRMQKQWIVAKANQPMTHEQTACMFKDPRGMSASMLIEQAGAKSEVVGGAEISQRQANFVIAQAGATSQDVLRLIDTVRGRVAERMGVELETQLEIW